MSCRLTESGLKLLKRIIENILESKNDMNEHGSDNSKMILSEFYIEITIDDEFTENDLQIIKSGLFLMTGYNMEISKEKLSFVFKDDIK